MATQTRVHRQQMTSSSSLGLLRRLLNALLNGVWYLHAPAQFTVALPPRMAFAALQTAARPSTERLHLRNVFAGGRRYYLQAEPDGFRMTTNAKESWRYAHRTSAVTIMSGVFHSDRDLTQVTLRSRMKVSYLLDVLWLPTFMSSLIVMTPWPTPVVGALVVAFYGLSWLGHRYHAALEAYEMLYFVEKAFEDFLPPLAPQIEHTGADVVYDLQRDFASAWEAFYQQVVQPTAADAPEGAADVRPPHAH
jgi:hypothetical protein